MASTTVTVATGIYFIYFVGALRGLPFGRVPFKHGTCRRLAMCLAIAAEGGWIDLHVLGLKTGRPFQFLLCLVPINSKLPLLVGIGEIGHQHLKRG
jgi:hypothetical protein